ncbi:MAG: PAS domain-containing protein, partial [Spirochaetes bacterium]|nr:PAS domain-containing protein [Spirochaetota bacterium]
MDLSEERKKVILLVEDEAIVALSEKKVLEAEGYRVQIASNGETAVEYIREHRIPVDLVLMDIDLGPGMDGTEAAQQILDIRPVPILFLTSHTEREYVVKAEKISSYGYVVKHTGDLVLIASVKMAFRLAEANQRIARELEERIRAENAQKRSESRLKRAELAAKLGNWELDLTRGKITGSEGAAKIYGLSGSDFPYEEVKKIPLPQFRPILDKALKELVQEGKPYEVEFQIRTADTGEIKDIYSVAFYEPDRRIVFGVIQDVTALKRTEKALRDAETLWRFALEGAGHGVWDWHIPSNRVYFSPAWKRMLGYQEEEIENRYEEWETRVHPEDLPNAVKAIEDLLNRRVELYQCEHRLRCKDGSYRWILDRGKVMEWGSDGKAIRAVGTHTDITERVEAEERIRFLLQEKELLLRETHHRILNNLSVIRSLLSLQANEVTSPEAVQTLREAQGRI